MRFRRTGTATETGVGEFPTMGVARGLAAGLEGQEYFALEEVPPATWREEIRKAIFGAIQEYLPTEAVSEYLRRYKPHF